jgi:hypothetical protein
MTSDGLPLSPPQVHSGGRLRALHGIRFLWYKTCPLMASDDL